MSLEIVAAFHFPTVHELFRRAAHQDHVGVTKKCEVVTYPVVLGYDELTTFYQLIYCSEAWVLC